MPQEVKTENGFSYIESGEGKPIVVLHGLMGTLSNFSEVLEYFSENGYRILIPKLPIYDLPLLRTNIKSIAKYIKRFMNYKKLDHAVLLGNSLGGHVALYLAKQYPKMVDSLVLCGSSGLYERSMGDSYPKRGDYEYIKSKAEEVFYDPKRATKDLVDNLFETVNNRHSVIRILALAKSAIRNNMAKDLPKMHTKTCLIWGKQDTVTPPDVAEEFNELLPNVELHWIDKCGHAPMMEKPKEFNRILKAFLDEKEVEN